MNNKIDYDEFADIKNKSFGIFDNSAMDEHTGVKSLVVPTGVRIEFKCQGCAAPTRIDLEWPEIIALKYGVSPALAFRGRPNIVQTPMGFTYSAEEHAWVPDKESTCQHCTFHYGLRITPNEPEGWLSSARQAGFIPQAYETGLSNGMRQLAASLSMQARAR